MQLTTSMDANDPHQPFLELHSVFTAVTGQTDLKFMPCLRRWFEWHKMEFTMDDLKCVLDYVMAVNRKNDWKYSLRFDHIVGDVERFNDLLGLARQRERERRVRHQLMSEGKREILGATFRDNQPEAKVPARGLRDVLRSTIDGLPN